MILEYHNIENKSGAYYQPPDQLRKDLQQLYDNGYATMDIHDYVTGNISTPAGKTPVVLTFDDATIGQFRYLPGGESIDPNCAVGILNDFAAAHPGFGHHATFFVLPSGFGQSGLKAAKYRYLVSHGYGIGNHTWTHPIMTHKTPLQVQEELGRDDIDIHAIIPDYRVDILAYPFGSRPKTQGKPDDTYIASGSWQGHPYKISAAFLVGAEPAPSPYSSKLKPYAIPRVQAIEKDLVSWIARFKANPRQKFISDGDPGSVSIPASMASQLNRNAVSDRKVVTY
jgi:peptidoglycan/xylan/chitin deacetylase (PgdA/CDA1 family)